MHFNLPDQLALEVAGYDQTRKKLAAVMAAEDRKRARNDEMRELKRRYAELQKEAEAEAAAHGERT
mgnify:CR=1 FL=1